MSIGAQSFTSAMLTDQLNRSGPDLKICPRSEAVPSQQFVRRSPTTFPFWSQVRDGGLICCLVPGRLFVGDTTLTDPVVMAPFQGSNLWSFPDSAKDPEEVSVDSPSSSKIVTAGSGSMMKWWVTAPSGPEKLDDGEPQ
ncbi:hypothetical protein EVAR_101021_1 [Eumeta japonica]|uniref:Uncharacterized protein n=1 Tax=Eumeta variegata TaxID=151549 RepID=A0A4C2AB48_EUMVA|nr:hypothetical protein EVAR_101021_1 [Eumeta japonica]